MANRPPDIQEPAENNGSRLLPFLAFKFRWALLAVFALTGRCAYETYLNHRNPDTRDPKEVARDVLIARAKIEGVKNPESRATEERVQKTVNAALCIANKVGHPIGDDYQGKDKIEHKDRKSGKYTFKGKTYSLLPNNSRNYEYDQRVAEFIHNVKDMQSSLPKSALSWLGDTAPEDILKQPLVCARNPENGECEKGLDGQICWLNKLVAEAYNRASADMHAAGKGRVMYGDCLRGPLEGFILFAYLNGSHLRKEGCTVTEGPGVMLPGNGFHGMGLATDLLNKNQAKWFLYKDGINCDFVSNDGEHCSFGEHVTNKYWYDIMETESKIELGIKFLWQFKK